MNFAGPDTMPGTAVLYDHQGLSYCTIFDTDCNALLSAVCVCKLSLVGV